MSTDTIRSEIDGYITELNQIKERLMSFSNSINSESLLHAESETTMIAIDSTLKQISGVDSETIQLNTITKLADDVQNVIISSNYLITKIQKANTH